MRDWMMLGLMVLLVPLSLSSTLVAYLLWGWSSVMAPHTWMYGFMQSVPYNQIFAIIALGRMVMLRETSPRRYEPSPTAILFVLFGVNALMSAAFAYEGGLRNWELCTNLLKALLFCLAMPIVLVNRFRLHLLVLVVAMGLSFHGFVDGLKVIASAGAHHVIGNAKLGDNNHVAVSVTMMLPLLLYLSKYSANWMGRAGFSASLAISLLAIIGTNSRGGALALAAMALWMALASRRKLFSIVTVFILAGTLIAVAPSSWTERMDTIQTAEQDDSFMGRVTAWRTSTSIALANPLLGGGFHAVQTPQVWEQFKHSPGLLGFIYIDNPGTFARAAHSIYFEILGDLGFIGLLLFMAILVRPFLNHWQIRQMVRSDIQRLQWATDLSNALIAAMVAYIIGGAGISAGYFEVMYMLVMLSELIRIQVKQLIDTARADAIR